MDGPASGSDLSNRSLRPLTAQEDTVGALLLQDAYNIIVSRVPSVSDRVVRAEFRALVVQVQCAMVLRVLNNPDGKLSETVDDYTYRLDAARSTGELYLSDAEAALLNAGQGSARGAFTITPGGRRDNAGYWSDTTTWVPL